MKNPWIKKWRPTKDTPSRVFPLAVQVANVAAKLGAETNEDGQFSSPELTAWYVKKYLVENNIKHNYPKGFKNAVV